MTPMRNVIAISVAGVVVLSLGFLAGVARGDTVWRNSSGKNAKPFELQKMKIEGLTAEGLLYRAMSSERASDPKPLKDIWKIAVDDEPNLNAAETAFVDEKWDAAVGG